MTLRSVHGAAAEGSGPTKVLETLPIAELPPGVPESADDASRQASEERGRFSKGNRRSVKGGRSHKGKPRMSEKVSLAGTSEDLPTRRYHVAAASMVKATARTIVATIGGGYLDPHTGYLLTSAGRAAKWANYYSDLAERMPAGSKEQRETVALSLSADEKASSHLRNAHEYAARMAEARAKHAPPLSDAERREQTLKRMAAIAATARKEST